MEPEQQITQTEIAASSQGHKKTLLVVIGIVILSAIITGIVYMIVREKKLAPLEQLQQLNENSRPVTTTTEERVKQLDGLSKESQPVKSSKEDRLKMLDSLNN